MLLFMANSYVSLRVIADKLLRHPMMAGISFEAIIDYTVDFMRIVGCFNFFEDKETTITLDNYQGLLPPDFYEIKQLRFKKGECYHTFTPAQAFYSSDETDCGHTYKIQGDRIFTSIKEGDVYLSYLAIPIDEEGYPMIPDNSKFTRALEAYIKKQWFTILFDMGKLQGAILDNTQREYAWAVGAVESEFQNFNLDTAKQFYQTWRSIIPKTNIYL